MNNTYFDEGFDARMNGQPLSDNPYSEFSDEGMEWSDGWNEVHENIELYEAPELLQ